MHPNLSLYVILDPEQCRHASPEEVAEAAIDGGATCIQLRAKSWSDKDILCFSRDRLLPGCRANGIALIINNRVDIAHAAGADGVHLGPKDLPVEAARALVGDTLVIGASAPDLERARCAVALGADYLGVGAIFEARASKEDASAPRGPSWLRAFREELDVPIVAIGGISLDTVGDVLREGADGVAVIRAVCAAPDPREATRRLRAVVAANAEGTCSER